MPERLPPELRLLYDLAQLLAAGPQQVESIFDRVCDEIGADFGFKRTIIVRLDPEADVVYVAAQHGAPDADRQTAPLEHFQILRRALDAREAIVVSDVLAEHALPREVAGHFGIRSAVAVPLQSEGRCLGFIAADREGAELTLTETELGLLTALGIVVGVVIEKAEQYERLQTALEELRRLDQAKSDFISIASHELRTPISVVCGVAATLHLRGPQLSEPQLDELRGTLYDQTQRLRDLTEKLLDLSRLDAGSVRLYPERFRPRESFDSLLPRICPDRLTDVAVEIDPDLEVTTDPAAFERVAANLVTNALRYGEPPVVVDAEANGRFRLVVEDRGHGVPPEFVPQLFERFTRSDRSRASVSQGAGLGLAIASAYAEALGGELRYEEADPHGARFVLVLPTA